MNNQALQWLYKELPDLVNKNVITQETAYKLHEYYGELKNTGKENFTIILFSILGTLLVGLGVISLFAHNWEQLSRPVRAGVSLFPLIIGQILAFWVLLKHPTSHALKEGIATFVSLMVGAAIALISQTYNISGDTGDFILSWMLLIVPLVYLMEVTIPAVIYVAGISAWAWYCSITSQKVIIFWPLLAIIIPHFIWALYQDKYNVRARTLATVMAISVCFGIEQTISNLDRIWPGSWIVIYSSIATLFYLLGTWEFNIISTNWQKPFRCLGGAGIFVMSLLLTFHFPWASMKGHSLIIGRNLSLIPLWDYFLSLLLVGTTISIFILRVKNKGLINSLFGALPLLAIIGCGLSAIAPTISMLLFDAFMFIISVIQIMMGVRTDNLSIINKGMFMLASLILVRFFDSDISIVAKGLVFIIVGVGFLITNVVIINNRKGVI